MKILTGLLAASAIAIAQPSSGWSTTVHPPQPNLPTVHLTLGYPGDYVPMDHAPIELRVIGDQLFDGFVGYAFEAEGKRTADVPRATRARHLRGFIDLMGDGGSRLPREVIIEWRDRNGRVVAGASAGTPPWSEKLQPLRIGASSRLVPTAAWFQGFREIVAPIDVLLSLPAGVRQAVFESGTEVFTIGVPTLPVTGLDGSLLPVTFESSIVHPKPRAMWLAGENGPRVVRWPRATWVASEDELREPLPSMNVLHVRADQWQSKVPRSAHNILVGLSQARTALLLVAVIASSVLLWWLSRRGAATVVIVVAIVLIAAHPLYRDGIRRRELQRTTETWTSGVGGAWSRAQTDLVYGAGPLRFEGQRVHRGLDAEPTPDWAELEANGRVVRVVHPEPWSLAEQWSSSVVRLDGVRVSVGEISADTITFVYELPADAEHVFATWTFGGGYFRGAKPLTGGRTGRATIRRGDHQRSMILGSAWDSYQRPLARTGGANRVRLLFIAKQNDTIRLVDWAGDVAASDFVPYTISMPMRMSGGGHTATMVIPEDGIPAEGEAVLTATWTNINPLRGGVTIDGDGGRLALPPATAAVRRIAASELRRIAREHRPLTFAMPATMDEERLESARLVMTVTDVRK